MSSRIARPASSSRNLASFGLDQLPNRGGLLCRERFDGKQGHQAGLPFAEQHREDAVKQIRGWRSLREAVQPVHELLVAGSESVMGHDLASSLA